MFAIRPLVALLGVALALNAAANDNAVKAASDAFGTSVGRESIGLYGSSSVRGFSPTAAGNVRIDGLYFDQVWGVSARLRTASQVRVGLSAQGFAFPAPTGIVDHQLRRPGGEGEGQISAVADHWGGRYLDVDFSQPLSDTAWGVTGGLSAQRIRYTNGTHAEGYNGSLALWWHPSPEREAMVFLSQHETPYDEIAPNVSPSARELPRFVTNRHFDGPHWSQYSGTARNRGVMLRETLAPDWVLRAGLFHSEFDDQRGASNLILNADSASRGQHLIVIDPPGLNDSDSGEIRLTHTVRGDHLQQRWHLQWAGRDRQRLYGGSQTIDLGQGAVGEPVNLPEPVFAFGPQSRDHVEQQWLGLAYEARIGRAWELNAGLQKTRYDKRLERPVSAAVEDRAHPWLGNLSGVWHADASLAFYAGYTRGLEESGIAPANASNRNQALPAILTSQRDAGLRWQLAPRMRLVAGVFDVRKPYFNLDAQSLYTQLGEVRHRGVEASLSGHPTPELRLLVGAVWMQPRVRGEAVTLGRVGSRPIGQPDTLLKLNAVWTPAGRGGMSLDAGLSYTGAMAATRDNQVELPPLPVLDLGARWPLTWAGTPMSLRLRMANAANRQAYELRGAGLYAEAPGRLVELGLSGRW